MAFNVFRETVKVQSSYDSVADAYAEHLFDELSHKPLDRHLLARFADAVRGRGLVADVGCGPGHIASFLSDRVDVVCGIDLSGEMIRLARQFSPHIDFRVGDMRALDFANESLAGIVSFYSIVHCEPSELAELFREFNRVLVRSGAMIVAFHVGDESVHVDDMWGEAVDLDFRFHQPGDVKAALKSAGFSVTESTERAPYEDVEYASRRCYLFAVAI